MSIRIGEQVVCINNVVNGKTDEISLNKKYTVIDSYKDYDNKWVVIINDNNLEGDYFDYRFIPLKEYRESKLKRILKK